MNNKNGFTLVELLSVVVVLALVLTISVTVATSLINKSKDTTYKISQNEIEANVSSYVKENTNLAFSPKDNYNLEYRYVTIKELIEYGYISNNIIGSYINDNHQIRAIDCIYVERNTTTKTISKVTYDENCNSGGNSSDKYCRIIESFVSTTIEEQTGGSVTKPSNLIRLYVCD